MVIIHTDNKKTLVGIFDEVKTMAVPAAQRIGFYARLTDMEGLYRFTIRVVFLGPDGEEPLAGVELAAVELQDRLSLLDIALNLPPLVLEKVGRYEVQLFWDDVYLGRATMKFIKIGEGD